MRHVVKWDSDRYIGDSERYIGDSEGDIWECWGYLGELEIFKRAPKYLESSERLNKDEYVIKA